MTTFTFLTIFTFFTIITSLTNITSLNIITSLTILALVGNLILCHPHHLHCLLSTKLSVEPLALVGNLGNNRQIHINKICNQRRMTKQNLNHLYHHVSLLVNQSPCWPPHQSPCQPPCPSPPSPHLASFPYCITNSQSPQ